MTQRKLLDTIGKAVSWFFATLFILIGFGAFISSDPTSGLLLLVMGGILLPPLATFINYPYFGIVKAIIFVICFFLWIALLEPSEEPVQPIASPIPEISESASPSPTPIQQTSPAPAPKPSPSPTPRTVAPSPNPTPVQRPAAPPPSPTQPPAPTVVESSAQSNCDPSYPDSDVCIPPPPPDLNCPNISYRNFTVQQPDPHGFDRDSDGIGCEEN